MTSRKLPARDRARRRLPDSKDKSVNDVAEPGAARGDLMSFAGVLAGDKEFADVEEDVRKTREKWFAATPAVNRFTKKDEP